MDKVKAKRNEVGHLVAKLSNGDEYTISEENEELRVSSYNSVAVTPVASNVVRIIKKDW